jgi:hypothetical protein
VFTIAATAATRQPPVRVEAPAGDAAQDLREDLATMITPLLAGCGRRRDTEERGRRSATMPAAGGVPEWPKGTGCKPVGSAFGGSNPPSPIRLARP